MKLRLNLVSNSQFMCFAVGLASSGLSQASCWACMPVDTGLRDIAMRCDEFLRGIRVNGEPAKKKGTSYVALGGRIEDGNFS